MIGVILDLLDLFGIHQLHWDPVEIRDIMENMING